MPFVDMWSPGYLGFMSSNHNGMLRMYEIFGMAAPTRCTAKLAVVLEGGGGRGGGDGRGGGMTSRECIGRYLRILSSIGPCATTRITARQECSRRSS